MRISFVFANKCWLSNAGGIGVDGVDGAGGVRADGKAGEVVRSVSIRK